MITINVDTNKCTSVDVLHRLSKQCEEIANYLQGSTTSAFSTQFHHAIQEVLALGTCDMQTLTFRNGKINVKSKAKLACNLPQGVIHYDEEHLGDLTPLLTKVRDIYKVICNNGHNLLYAQDLIAHYNYSGILAVSLQPLLEEHIVFLKLMHFTLQDPSRIILA